VGHVQVNALAVGHIRACDWDSCIGVPLYCLVPGARESDKLGPVQDGHSLDETS
jgi:hypothetical protein